MKGVRQAEATVSESCVAVDPKERAAGFLTKRDQARYVMKSKVYMQVNCYDGGAPLGRIQDQYEDFMARHRIERQNC